VKSVLLVPNDYVGPRMAGPGIRYYHFAQELSRRFTVSLLIPNDPGNLDLEGVQVLRTRSDQQRQLKELSRSCDAVVAQGGLDAWSMGHLARTDVRAIYDLYVHFSEVLAFQGGAGDATQRRRLRYRAYVARQRLLLASGSAFLCANEEQRISYWVQCTHSRQSGSRTTAPTPPCETSSRWSASGSRRNLRTQLSASCVGSPMP
jgi:hypothetical protein